MDGSRRLFRALRFSPPLPWLPRGWAWQKEHRSSAVTRSGLSTEPLVLQTVYYPMEFVAEGGATHLLVPDDIDGGQTEGVLKYLESTLGVKQVGLRDMIIARPPRRLEALLRPVGQGTGSCRRVAAGQLRRGWQADPVRAHRLPRRP